MASPAQTRLEAAQIAQTVRQFFLLHSECELLEADGSTMLLGGEASGYSLETQGGGIVAHWWSPAYNLVRRIESAHVRGNHLRLSCRRMGQSRSQTVWLRPRAAGKNINQDREGFRHQLLAAIRQSWPEWKARNCGSISAPWIKVILESGDKFMAVLAAGPRENRAAHETALTQLLIWRHSLQLRPPRKIPAGWHLIFPDPNQDLAAGPKPSSAVLPESAYISAWKTAALRISGLRHDRPLQLWLFTPGKPLLQPEPVPLPALVSQIGRAPDFSQEFSAAARELAQQAEAICPSVKLARDNCGGACLQLHGLEIARQARGWERSEAEFVFGLGGGEQSPLTAENWPLFQHWVSRLCQFRRARPDNMGTQLPEEIHERNLWYTAQPEAWLQTLLRENLGALDPDWNPDRIYSQVVVSVAGDSGRLDLLLLDRAGRICILELKTSEDADFPLQALEYWLRIRQLHRDGRLQAAGYFPGWELAPSAPRLYLIAPALRRHPAHEILLAEISAEVPITQLLLNENWRSGPRLIERRERRC